MGTVQEWILVGLTAVLGTFKSLACLAIHALVSVIRECRQSGELARLEKKVDSLVDDMTESKNEFNKQMKDMKNEIERLKTMPSDGFERPIEELDPAATKT